MSVTPLFQVLVVGGGGAVGAVCRHVVGLRLTGRRSLVAVNVAGSVALGGVLAAPIGHTVVLVAGVWGVHHVLLVGGRSRQNRR